MPRINAEITPVKKSQKIRKKRRLDAESTPDDPGVGQQPRSCLKLPPGWNNLSPTELVAQMRIVNRVGDDSLENKRISSLVDKLEEHPADDFSKVEEGKKSKLPRPTRPRKQVKKRKYPNDECIKSSGSNPVILPPNWQQSSPSTLAAQLRATHAAEDDLKNKALTQVFAKLENFGINTKNKYEDSGSIIKLPANWAESDSQTLAADIQACNVGQSSNPGLTDLLTRLQTKQVSPIARKFPPIKLLANWAQSSPQTLAASIQSSAAAGQSVSGLVASLVSGERRSAAASAVTRPRKEKTGQHVMLPPGWEQSRPGELADRMRQFNSKAVPAAVIDRLKNEDRSSKLESSASPVKLPRNWQQSSTQALARKIKSKLHRSANKEGLGKLLARLENPRKQEVKKKESSSRIMLPKNWANSSSKDLVSLISSKQTVDQATISKILTNLETRPFETKSDADNTPVKLPQNWASFSSQDLEEALKEKSSNGRISEVLLNLRKRKQVPVLKERSSHGRARSRRRSRASRGGDRNSARKSSQNARAIQLPLSWENVCPASNFASWSGLT